MSFIKSPKAFVVSLDSYFISLMSNFKKYSNITNSSIASKTQFSITHYSIADPVSLVINNLALLLDKNIVNFSHRLFKQIYTSLNNLSIKEAYVVLHSFAKD